MERISNSQVNRPAPRQEPKQAQQTEQAREAEPARRNQQARSYSRLSPEQQRAESQARKPRARILGSQIDVYA
jgi:hypothetical protein